MFCRWCFRLSLDEKLCAQFRLRPSHYTYINSQSEIN